MALFSNSGPFVSIIFSQNGEGKDGVDFHLWYPCKSSNSLIVGEKNKHQNFKNQTAVKNGIIENSPDVFDLGMAIHGLSLTLAPVNPLCQCLIAYTCFSEVPTVRGSLIHCNLYYICTYYTWYLAIAAKFSHLSSPMIGVVLWIY